MHARSRLLACAVAAAALVLGCSDDPEIDEEADQDLVDEVALTVDDLPDGFEEREEEDDDDEDDDSDEALDECAELVGIDPDAGDDNEVAEAGDDISFVREDAAGFTQISSVVTSMRDAGLGREVLEAFDDDEFVDCFVEAFEEEFADDESIDSFDLDITDPAVDGDAGIAIVVDLESGGIPFELQVHMVLVDRFGMVVQVVAGPDGVDDDLVEDAFDAMLERLEDATG